MASDIEFMPSADLCYHYLRGAMAYGDRQCRAVCDPVGGRLRRKRSDRCVLRTHARLAVR